MAFVFIRQAQDSNTCGQCCVAMLACVSVEEACEAAGTRGKTRTKHIRDALRRFGVACGDRRIRHRTAWECLPDATLLLHVTNGHSRHWIIYRNRKFYDPAAGVFSKPPKYLVERRGVPTSYLIIETKDTPPC